MQGGKQVYVLIGGAILSLAYSAYTLTRFEIYNEKKSTGQSTMTGISSTFSTLPYHAEKIQWQGREKARLQKLTFAEGMGRAEEALLEGDRLTLAHVQYTGKPAIEIKHVLISDSVAHLKAEKIHIEDTIPSKGMVRLIRARSVVIMPRLVQFILPKMRQRTLDNKNRRGTVLEQVEEGSSRRIEMPDASREEGTSQQDTFILTADNLEVAQSAVFIRGILTNTLFEYGICTIESPRAIVKWNPLRLVYDNLIYHDGKQVYVFGRSILNLEKGVLFTPSAAYSIKMDK